MTVKDGKWMPDTALGKTLVGIAGVLVTLTAIYTGLGFFGVNLPRPAWSVEVISAHNRADEALILAAGSYGNSIQQQFYVNQREQRSYKQRNESVPRSLKREEDLLQRQLESIRKRAREAEERRKKRMGY